MSAPYERILVIDFETRWDKKDYTLRKLTTEEYIRHEKFKAFGVGYRYYGEDEVTWVSEKDLPEFFDSIPWDTTAVLAHNAQFDVAILSWVYGHTPCFIFDSLSMARALRGLEAGNSLMQLAKEFGLPPKGDAVHSTDGLEFLTPEIEQELSDYCKHDVVLCAEVFNRLYNVSTKSWKFKGYPKKELKLIDMTLKMFVNPVLQLDSDMLQVALEEEQQKRKSLLAKLNVEEKDLASNDKFAEVLRSMSIKPPTKISVQTGKEAYAFAKNDALFQQLLNSTNEDIASLCQARLAVKSTLERTRAQRFLDISKRGALPVPLNYYGAHTGRWSASKGSGLNLQNLKRGSFLRSSIMAPKDSMLIVCDLSQIEPRILAHLTDDYNMLDIFSRGGDPYAAFGARMFNIPGMTKKTHPELRQSAKSALLGAGYGLGWSAFAAQLLTGFLGAPPLRYIEEDAYKLGVTTEDVYDFLDMEDTKQRLSDIACTCTKKELIIHAVTAKKIIDKYREAAAPVKSFWRWCGDRIDDSLSDDGNDFKQGKVYTYKCLQVQYEKVVLPSGLCLRYPNLRPDKDDKGRLQWVYGEKKKKRLYGGKLTENIVQAVARCVMTDGMIRIQKRYSCVLTVHDEVVCVVPKVEEEEAKTWVLAQMTMEPKYLPEIPLNSDIDSALRYGDAK